MTDTGITGEKTDTGITGETGSTGETGITREKTEKEKKQYISDAYDSFIKRARECKIGYITDSMDRDTIISQDFCFLINNFEREDIFTLVDTVMEDTDDRYCIYSTYDKDVFRTMILHMFDDIVEYLK